MSSEQRIFRWGMIELPASSLRFSRALELLSDARLIAVAIKHSSRNEYVKLQDENIHCYANYEDLILDPQVELVYIAAPLHERIPLALACLEYGKGVLCEAPIGLDADSIREVFAKAEKKKLPFVEGLFLRFFPAIDRSLRLVSEGTIGDLMLLQVDACKKSPLNEQTPAQTTKETLEEAKKGIWLAHGMYPVFFSVALFGAPTHISGHVYLDKETGEAQHYVLSLRHTAGRLASLMASSRIDGPCEAYLHGTKSRIHVLGPFYGKTILRMYTASKHTGFVKFNYLEDNLHYPITHIQHLLEEGCFHSPLWGQKETLAWTQTLCRLMEDIPTYTV